MTGWLRKNLSLMLGALFSATFSAHAQEPPEAGRQNYADPTVFGYRVTWEPSELEQEVLKALSRNRPRHMAASGAVIDASAGAHFVFDGSVPTVVCAPLQLCDIELQAGEKVQGLNIADSARWNVEAAISGEGHDAVQHVLVHPKDVGIRTVLVVTTNRRTYRLRLLADEKRYMTSIVFSYPGKALEVFRQHRDIREQQQGRAGGRFGGRGAQTQLSGWQALSFAYELEGDDPPWKPVRVYNNGLQTVIEMPFAMRQTEAPALLVIRAEGGPFSDDEEVQVNFRVQGTRYLVDAVFDVADLIAGVGALQQRVRIRRLR